MTKRAVNVFTIIDTLHVNFREIQAIPFKFSDPLTDKDRVALYTRILCLFHVNEALNNCQPSETLKQGNFPI